MFQSFLRETLTVVIRQNNCIFMQTHSSVYYIKTKEIKKNQNFTVNYKILHFDTVV